MEHRPEVVLLDIGLPTLNGYEVGRRIRDEAWGKDVILIALTGWGQEEDRRKSQEAGFDGHLVKPVNYPALMALLSSLGVAR
jgi:DNA-binding response OmpR family regulator